MPGFFEALSKFPKREPKKFYVRINGVDHEVSLKKKLWANNHSEENLMIKDGQIVLKPQENKSRVGYTELRQADMGYVFLDDDIHWPDGVQEGGMTWLTRSE